MEDAINQLKSAVSAVEAAQSDVTSQLAVEDPVWVTVKSALVNAGWTPPAPVEPPAEPTPAE